MIANFLRPPQNSAEWIADLLRALGLASIFIAAIGWSVTDAGTLALALPALLVPRSLGVRAWFDILYVVMVLAAAWSNVLGLYEAVPWWDLLLHFACSGVLAAMLYLALAAFGIVPRPPAGAGGARVPIVIVTSLGLALSSIWEMVEWFGREFISSEIFVGYQDTIADMALGGLGALAASVLVAFVPLLRFP